MTREAVDRRVFWPSKQISCGSWGENSTHISGVMWGWSYEGFFEVRQRTVFCIISIPNIAW